jgi:hypothetical protein
MLELKPIRRVTVYADGSLEAILLKQFLALGSNGYTISACRGKGEHDTVDDPFATVTRVRSELLVQPEVAEKILAYVDGAALKSLPVAACVETVQVVASEKY